MYSPLETGVRRLPRSALKGTLQHEESRGFSPLLFTPVTVACWAQPIEQVMSWPQHIGDLILPCPSGHSEMCTVLPSSLLSVLCTSSLPQVPHVIVPTLMPHFSHV